MANLFYLAFWAYFPGNIKANRGPGSLRGRDWLSIFHVTLLCRLRLLRSYYTPIYSANIRQIETFVKFKRAVFSPEGNRETHTLIRMTERNSLIKIRLMSSGFTPVLFTHKEMSLSWIRPRHLTGRILRNQKSDPKPQRHGIRPSNCTGITGT